MLEAVSFQQISRILELTDGLEINREWVEIPLTPETPGQVTLLPNGKLEIIVDATIPFEEWLDTLELKVKDIWKVSSS
jgi:hypothetical protein